MTYLIGEALTGKGDEIAHIDLCMGDKEGAIGKAFAQALASPSVGHTPLLAVIRPNLPPKPHTLVVPKVTVKNLDDVGKIFGPAQAAVAKAVADAVEDGVIPEDKLDEWVIICGVFIHPNAKDFAKIYQFNYTATKLALKRAMDNYPSLEKMLYEKDRAKHPIMGFRRPRLWRPPYLQIALDVTSFSAVERILEQVPSSDRIILEAGTPLIKKYGVNVISKIRELARDAFIVADLKTMDGGIFEAEIAFEAGADLTTVMACADYNTIQNVINIGKNYKKKVMIDMLGYQLGIKDFESKLVFLDYNADDIILLTHLSFDKRKNATEAMIDLKLIQEINKFKHAVAGGVDLEVIKRIIDYKPSIIVVGSSITKALDPLTVVKDFRKVISN